MVKNQAVQRPKTVKAHEIINCILFCGFFSVFLTSISDVLLLFYERKTSDIQERFSVALVINKYIILFNFVFINTLIFLQEKNYMDLDRKQILRYTI